MISSDQLHPLPRYGLAVLLFDKGLDSFLSEESLIESAVDYIERALTKFMIAPKNLPDESKGTVKYAPYYSAKPGKENGQIGAKGFFVAPHIITGNDAAKIVKEVSARLVEAKNGKRPNVVKLKKNFAPTSAQINAGVKSMSEPTVSFVEALLTIVATLSGLKPAAYVNDKVNNSFSNTALIPDISISSCRPYIRIISKMITQAGDDIWLGSFKGSKYGRPLLFKGNYSNAPRGIDLGALGLLSAIGQFVKESANVDLTEARSVLKAMANRPIYLFAYEGSRQESFSHHLIESSLSGALYTTVNSIREVQLLNMEGSKFSESNKNTWELFLKVTSRFLTLFQSAYARDFFAFRASYPRAFQPIFKTYFMQIESIPESIVKSAEVYGQRLNLSAYLGALEEIKDDQHRKRSGQSADEYKNRILTQLESSIASAKTGADLISRLSTIVGRSSNLDFPLEAAEFMREAVSGRIITVDQAKQLATAFMRLKSPKKETKVANDSDSETNDTVDESDTSAMDLSSF